MSDYNELFKNIKNAASEAMGAAKEFASAAGDKAKDFASGAGDKAKGFAAVARVTMDLRAERESAKEAYAEIGRLYFESADHKNPGEAYIRPFDQVLLANAAIERLEAELAEIKAELGDDCDCFDDSFESIVEADEACCSCSDDGSIEIEITVEKDED